MTEITEGSNRRFLNEKQTASYLGLSVKTLQRYRLTESCLPYIKLGKRVLYDMNDLNEYMESNKINPRRKP